MIRFSGLFLLAVFFWSGCNEISSGDKRLKLEYLYKMKSQLTQVMEVSYRIRKYEAVTGYEKNISSVKKEVSKTEPLKGWKEGENFKESFINLLNDDLKLTDSLSKLDSATRFDSNKVILKIQNRQYSLMESLDSLISIVDRE